MARQPHRERAPITEWVAESLRTTGFPIADAEFTADNWWQAVVLEDPEAQTVRPRTRERQEQGPFQRGRLILRVQPSRIDWELTPSPMEMEGETGLEALGTFGDACRRFCELMTRWFPLSPRLDRLAFGATALLQVPSRIDGYLRLSAYLPSLQIDTEGSTDLLYRINRPRPSRTNIPNLTINRLSTWTVGQLEFHTLAIGPGEAPRVSRGEPTFACRVEFDMNTPPSFAGEFASPQLEHVFQELVELVLETLQQGDQP